MSNQLPLCVFLNSETSGFYCIHAAGMPQITEMLGRWAICLSNFYLPNGLVFVFLSLLKVSRWCSIIPELLEGGSHFSAQVFMFTVTNGLLFFPSGVSPLCFIMMEWYLKRLIPSAGFYSNLRFLILFILYF